MEHVVRPAAADAISDRNAVTQVAIDELQTVAPVDPVQQMFNVF